MYLTRNRSILVERTISLGGGCLALSHWKRVSIENMQIICLFVTSMSPSPPWCAVLQMMSGASLDELWQHKCCPQHLGCAETNQKLEVNASWNPGVIDHDTLDICVVMSTACLWGLFLIDRRTRRIGEIEWIKHSIKTLLKCKKSRVVSPYFASRV